MQTETSQVHPNVVPVPKWIRWVHIAQAVLALIVLGLVSYSLSFYNSLNIGSTYGLSFPIVNSWGFNIFTVIYTWIIIIYIELTPRFLPSIYNKWAVFVLEDVAALFWLSSFSALASYTANTILFTCRRETLFDDADCSFAPRHTSAAAAGIGGILFVLFIITAVITGLHTIRHHRSTSTAGQPNQAPYTGQSNEMQNVTGTNKSMTDSAGINASGDAHNHSTNPGYYNQTPNPGYTQGPNVQNQGAYSQPASMGAQATYDQPQDMSKHATYQQPNTQSNPPHYATTGV